MFSRIQYVILISLLISTSPNLSQAQDIYVKSAQIGLDTGGDVDQIIVEIDELISEISAQPNVDRRLVFDLARRKADLLIAEGRDAEAADVVAELASFAAQFRDELQVSVPLLHLEAANLYGRINNFRASRAQLLAMLEEQRDGGQSAQVLAATLEDIAKITDQMNSPEQAKRYREAAKVALSPDAAPTRGEGQGFREVEVFYATDRARSGKDNPDEFYGWGRGELELGLATVTIPDTHVKGLVETPSVWRLEFGPSPAKHVVLQSVMPIKSDAFYEAMQQRLETRRNKELFVFIHGYNVQFDQAAKRAA